MASTEWCPQFKEKCHCGRGVCLKVNKKLIDTKVCRSKEHVECEIFKQQN